MKLNDRDDYSVALNNFNKLAELYFYKQPILKENVMFQ